MNNSQAVNVTGFAIHAQRLSQLHYRSGSSLHSASCITESRACQSHYLYPAEDVPIHDGA